MARASDSSDEPTPRAGAESASRPAAGLAAAPLKAAREVFRPSGPPTDELPVLASGDGVNDDRARAVIDLAMRVGIALLATGAGAASVVGGVRRLCAAYGLVAVQVDVTYTNVIVSYQRGPGADPITVMRVVPFRNQDFTRLERLRALVRSLEVEPVDIDDARVRFEGVVTASHPYRRWVVTVGNAILAAAVTVLIGGGPLITLISFSAAVIIDRVLLLLSKAGVASFFAQVIAATIPTAAATLVVWAGAQGLQVARDASPSLIVASGIVLLLSGLSIVGAAQDALGGYYVTAGARAFEVLVLTLGIVIGISLVLAIGNRLGLYVAVTTQTSLEPHLLTQVLCAAAISGSFAVAAYASGRVVVLGGLLGSLAWLVSALLQRQELGAATAGVVATAVVGFIAAMIARRLRVGTLALTGASIIPLLPGRAIYQGLSQVLAEPRTFGMTGGLTTVIEAAGTALALAAGVTIGTYTAAAIHSWRKGRALRPATGAERR